MLSLVNVIDVILLLLFYGESSSITYLRKSGRLNRQKFSFTY